MLRYTVLKFLLPLIVMVCGWAWPDGVGAQAHQPIDMTPHDIHGATPLHAALNYVIVTRSESDRMPTSLPVAVADGLSTQERAGLERLSVPVKLVNRVLVCERPESELPRCSTPADPLAVLIGRVNRSDNDTAIVELTIFRRSRLPTGELSGGVSGVTVELVVRSAEAGWMVETSRKTSAAVFTNVSDWSW